ncbi:MAG TPA: YraN family protein [Acidimicrobiia bacterium]|nr:YraN family protein [Acidimicrobiia bacterium]
MGLGHVPTGSVPRAREGADVSRRQRRRAGTARDLDLSDRARIGGAGERIAARFLTDHGMAVVAANVEVGRGELDLLAVDGMTRVAVEVRTTTGEGDPIDAVDPLKRRQVAMLAARIGAGRVDFVGVGIGSDGAVVHWVPGCD